LLKQLKSRTLVRWKKSFGLGYQCLRESATINEPFVYAG
jgi:hypothetical protein